MSGVPRTSYQEWLLDHLGKIADPVECAQQTLLRRGFLLWKSGGAIGLRATSHRQDYDWLNFVARRARWKQTCCHVEGEGSVQGYEVSSMLSPDAIQRVILHPGVRGMTFVNYRYSTWKDFKLNSWGHRIPVMDLDIGVAAIVKALPFARVRTNLCCDGHDVRPAELWFPSPFFSRWFERVLDASSEVVDGLQEVVVTQVDDRSLQLIGPAEPRRARLLFEWSQYLASMDSIQRFSLLREKYIAEVEARAR